MKANSWQSEILLHDRQNCCTRVYKGTGGVHCGLDFSHGHRNSISTLELGREHERDCVRIHALYKGDANSKMATAVQR
jgi:hypothetical protein